MSLLLVALVTLSASVAQDLRWTNTVKVRRQSEPDPDMGKIVSDLRGMTYGGEIKLTEQDGTSGLLRQSE